MDFELSAEQRAIRDTIRSFIRKEVIPLEAEFLRRSGKGQTPIERETIRELQLAAKRFGFWGMSTPEKYGGMELPAVTQSLIYTELGRTCLPFLLGGEADNILYEADPCQTHEYLLPTIAGDRVSCFALTEPDAGSDATNIKTTARRSGSDWVMSGEKTFITNGNHADFAIVIALTNPQVGARHGSTAFLVDRTMGWTSSPISVMGWQTPASLHFGDVRVPASSVLGEEGQGFELATRWIGRGRFVIPSQSVGIAERVLQMALDYSRVRRTFGRPLIENQAIQWMIADSHVELEAARWLTLHAAWLIDQGADARQASSVAKLYGAGMVSRVVDRALQIHGGLGYTRELPIEHWYRAVRVFRIFEGSDEVQRMTIARNLVRGHDDIGLA